MDTTTRSRPIRHSGQRGSRKFQKTPVATFRLYSGILHPESHLAVDPFSSTNLPPNRHQKTPFNRQITHQNKHNFHFSKKQPTAQLLAHLNVDNR